MNGHPTREEDFDLYALGALEGEEKRAVEDHVAGCAECARKLSDARGRIAMLALAAPAHSPAPHVKENLLRQVVKLEAARAASRAGERTGGIQNWWTAVWIPAAAVLGVLTIWLWVSNARLNEQLAELRKAVEEQTKQTNEARAKLNLEVAPDTVKVALKPMPEMPTAWAQVDYNPRQGVLSYTGDLPMPPAHMTYQLWLVPESGSPINVGVFLPPAAGQGSSFMMHLSPGMAAKAFAVTVEPAGGMPQPTGPKVLIGAVS